MAIGPAVVDTNVLIYALSGTYPAADAAIKDGASWGLLISIITKIELLTKVHPGQEGGINQLLNQCTLVYLDDEIADVAIRLRKQHKLKTPDAIVYATALVSGRTLVTFNTKDFKQGMASVHIPGGYERVPS